METPEVSQDALRLNALATQNANVSRTVYAHASERSATKRQKLDDASEDPIIKRRFRNEYSDVETLPPSITAKLPTKQPGKKASKAGVPARPAMKLLEGAPSSGKASTPAARDESTPQNMSLTTRGVQGLQQQKPEWHAPWKLMRVISGHLGWVRSLAVEPGNKWFASGAGDRTIKIWDLATGSLRLTLTGHISTVRGLAVSPRHPYLFSCGEDKMVKCWDLETNKVIRHYHGHLSGVYTLALHPTLDVLVTGGRDGVARVWDMRTRSNIHVLSGHTQTVSDLVCQEADPQVITGSLDSTVRLWDLAAGKTMGVLTHHKKGVRALATHPSEFTFASGSTGSVKQWKCPEGAFMQNFEGHNAIINTMSVNEQNVFFTGGDNGSMSFWDWKTGHRFQSLDTTAQPGSLDAEAGIMSSTFDRSGLRLICGEADKTIKIWKQDETATEESHPLEWKPTLARRKF
ncbi:pre-mRNA-splicing factor prp46 [Fusarium oxysporum]|uniref:Pre-mRNA-splicing factor PRP46 n=1 Tax=Fusarium oxysporum f. sp. cubense (strain race 1) TaxID=1229664 RepID=N4U9L5_FUSC1|nr:Pre-mRNA-splicing factor prp46 [Fusarium oxysporum f. sp. cubense race 1]KAJ4031534.1 pre-mRNA-splicing factor prp46 [Fusarium oxysporum]KAJ4060659.1 pre-mRNA-splicing factor prp46 [Fusarium oxysporum]KAJ4064046.1 pre-mRNA-splicing factor prp46 [Fusarium oxysporum]KAJ4077124.1 pre-mRNA-splicing factor prp46 [Fusarium oxysporum]